MHTKNLIMGLLFSTAAGTAGGQAIQSLLEVYDLETGRRAVVATFDGRIEAPNWSPDGKWLVYNSGGTIYRIPAGGGEPEALDLGGVEGCNNDHVISSDGTLLAFSANGPASHSQVYVMPLAGGKPGLDSPEGTPVLVTPKGPSYLHGISPDNRTLAYCAERNGQYDIYTIPSAGGEEVRLTRAEGLDDGPEYAPDGQYIWFNSVRSGLMQVWRMKVDGSGQEQVTFDRANNWFPHVSPDGSRVVFITYREGDVDPGDHPPGKMVELRMIPSSGGDPVTLAGLYGGQGTINVNSWSPDSKKFAFVSYRLKGLFGVSCDVGFPHLKGSAAYDEERDRYTLTGAGENMWGTRDRFHFAWTRVTGDFTLSARVRFEGKGTNPHRKMGIMIRETLDGDAPYADVAVHGDGLTSLQYRPGKGAETMEVKTGAKAPDHVTLSREGNSVVILAGRGIDPLSPPAGIEISLPETCYVGLFICSHETDVIEKGIFSDVVLDRPPR